MVAMLHNLGDVMVFIEECTEQIVCSEDMELYYCQLLKSEIGTQQCH